MTSRLSGAFVVVASLVVGRAHSEGTYEMWVAPIPPTVNPAASATRRRVTPPGRWHHGVPAATLSYRVVACNNYEVRCARRCRTRLMCSRDAPSPRQNERQP